MFVADCKVCCALSQKLFCPGPFLRVTLGRAHQQENAVNFLLSQPAVPYRTARVTICGQGRTGKTAFVRGVRNGQCRLLVCQWHPNSSAMCSYPVATFEETASTCGADTMAVTSVGSHANKAWAKDLRSETRKLMRRMTVNNPNADKV